MELSHRHTARSCYAITQLECWNEEASHDFDNSGTDNCYDSFSNVNSMSSFDLDELASLDEIPTIAEHSMDSSSKGIIEECHNQWYQQKQQPSLSTKPVVVSRRTVHFNEITTLHVYNPKLPPAIPTLFQPALQKTVLSLLPLCPMNYRMEDNFKTDKNFAVSPQPRRNTGPISSPTRKMKKSAVFPKRCASIAA